MTYWSMAQTRMRNLLVMITRRKHQHSTYTNNKEKSSYATVITNDFSSASDFEAGRRRAPKILSALVSATPALAFFKFCWAQWQRQAWHCRSAVVALLWRCHGAVVARARATTTKLCVRVLSNDGFNNKLRCRIARHRRCRGAVKARTSATATKPRSEKENCDIFFN